MMEIVNLNDNPEAILTMAAGELARLDGHLFCFEVLRHMPWPRPRPGSGDVFLTLIGNTEGIERRTQSYADVHVRDGATARSGPAVMTREQLASNLQTGNYNIS